MTHWAGFAGNPLYLLLFSFHLIHKPGLIRSMINPRNMHLLCVIIIAGISMPGRAGAVPVDIRIRPVAVGQPLLLD